MDTVAWIETIAPGKTKHVSVLAHWEKTGLYYMWKLQSDSKLLHFKGLPAFLLQA